MEDKNKKILVILLVVVAFVAIVAFLLNNKKEATPTDPTPPTIVEPTTNGENQPADTMPVTEDILAIENITGKLTMVDIGAVKVETEAGEELTLNISQEEGASFIKQPKQGEDTFMNEEIGLLDLPLNKTVEIQYNTQSNNLMMVIVTE
jgi:hypothetical protein